MSQEITQLLLNHRDHVSAIDIDSVGDQLPRGFFERFYILNPRNDYANVRHDIIKPLGREDLTLATMILCALAIDPLNVIYPTKIDPPPKPVFLESAVDTMPLMSWPELLALNPDVLLDNKTTSATPKVRPSDAPNGGSGYKKSAKVTLSDATPKYGSNLENNIRKLIRSNGDPTELYNHTYMEGNRNESTYRNFVTSWISSQIRDIINHNSYTALLKDNTNLSESWSMRLGIESDGRIYLIELGKPEGLVDNYDIEDKLTNRLGSLPKAFVPYPGEMAKEYSPREFEILGKPATVSKTFLWQGSVKNPYSTSKSIEEDKVSFKTIRDNNK